MYIYVYNLIIVAKSEIFFDENFFRWYKNEKNFLKNYEKNFYIKCLNFDCLEDKMFGKLFVFNIILYFDKKGNFAFSFFKIIIKQHKNIFATLYNLYDHFFAFLNFDATNSKDNFLFFSF